MCPFCLATAALIAGGALGGTGLSVFVTTKILKKLASGKAAIAAAETEI